MEDKEELAQEILGEVIALGFPCHEEPEETDYICRFCGSESSCRLKSVGSKPTFCPFEGTAADWEIEE